MAKTLAIRALQKGVGSMDYVDSLLLMEPEDESKNSDQEPNVAADDDASPLCVPPASTQVIDQEPVPEWCNCSCCRTMPQDMENKTSVVGEEVVFRKQGAFENFAQMQNIYCFVPKIQQISAMTDRTVVAVLSARLHIETIF